MPMMVFDTDYLADRDFDLRDTHLENISSACSGSFLCIHGQVMTEYELPWRELLAMRDRRE